MSEKQMVEKRNRCKACGAVWGQGFVRKEYLDADAVLRCPFCGKREAAAEMVEHKKEGGK
jgi:DNA-directed RNA polymerase subunit RPC12/RpoP